MSNIQPIRDTSKLEIPRNTYPASISSTSNNPFKRTPSSTGASDRYLSRTNTGTTDLYIAHTNAESQSIVTIDKIPSAKPSVTYSDLLWTQIDVLDDVRNMAGEVRNRGSFFNDKFNEELGKLKQSQNKLLETMSTQHFSDLDASEHQKQLYHLSRLIPSPTTNTSGNLLHEENIVHENEESKNEFENKKRQQEKINMFFKEDDLELKNQTIYKKQNFDDVNQYVSEIKQDLKILGASMKQFDENTREIW